MKQKEIHDLSTEALVEKGAETREQLFRLRFKHQLGNTDVVRQIQVSRKDLARVKSEVRAREIAEEEQAGTRRPRHRSRAQRKRTTEARHNAEARAKRN